MIGKIDIKVNVDDKECVFTGKFFIEVNGQINLNVDTVNVLVKFSEDNSSEDKSPKTRLNTRDDNTLEILCVNHNAYSPLSRGVVKPIQVFTQDNVQHYLQFTSSIYSKESDCREIDISITKDN